MKWAFYNRKRGLSSNPTGLNSFLMRREYGMCGYREHNFTGLGQQLAEEKATLPTKNQACELTGQSRSTFLTVFSPDKQKIASTHGDHTVRVTDIRTGRCTHKLTGHPRTPWCIAFHPTMDGILASGCLGGQVRIWDLHGGGSEVWKSNSAKKNYVISSITFHPTDQVLVIATNNCLLFWNWSRPEPFAMCKTDHDYEKVRWVKFDPLGHYLYTGIANASTIETDSFSSNIGNSSSFIGAFSWTDQYNSVLEQVSNRGRNTNNNGMNSGSLSPTHSDSLASSRAYAASVSRLHERQQNLNTDRDADRNADRSTDRGADRGAERSADRSTDRGAERGTNRHADRSTDRVADRGADRGADRRVDRGADRSAERGRIGLQALLFSRYRTLPPPTTSAESSQTGPNRADIYTAAASDWIMQGPHEERQVVRVRNENAAGTPASQNSSLYSDIAPSNALQSGGPSDPLSLFPLETHTIDSLDIADQPLASSDVRTEFVQSPSTGREHLSGHEARIELVRNDAHVPYELPSTSNGRHSSSNSNSSLMLAGMESSDIRRNVSNSSFSPFVPDLSSSHSDIGNVSEVSNDGVDMNTAHITSITSSILRSRLSISPTLSLDVPSSIENNLSSRNEHNYASTNATSSLSMLASNVFNNDAAFSSTSTNTTQSSTVQPTSATAQPSVSSTTQPWLRSLTTPGPAITSQPSTSSISQPNPDVASRPTTSSIAQPSPNTTSQPSTSSIAGPAPETTQDATHTPSRLSLLSSRIMPRTFSAVRSENSRRSDPGSSQSDVTLCNNRYWPLLRNRNSSLRRTSPYTCRRHGQEVPRRPSGSGRAGLHHNSGMRTVEQPQRLASILETEVRQALERVQARQQDIRVTLDALDMLRGTLHVENNNENNNENSTEHGTRPDSSGAEIDINMATEDSGMRTNEIVSDNGSTAENAPAPNTPSAHGIPGGEGDVEISWHDSEPPSEPVGPLWDDSESVMQPAESLLWNETEPSGEPEDEPEASSTLASAMEDIPPPGTSGDNQDEPDLISFISSQMSNTITSASASELPESGEESHEPEVRPTTVDSSNNDIAESAGSSVTESSGAPGHMSNLCDQLDRRLEHLNQLDRRVTDITRRLSERVQSLNDRMNDRERQLTGSEANTTVDAPARGTGSGERLRQLAEFRVRASSRLSRIMSRLNGTSGDANEDHDGNDPHHQDDPPPEASTSSGAGLAARPLMGVPLPSVANSDGLQSSDQSHSTMSDFTRRRRLYGGNPYSIDDDNSSDSSSFSHRHQSRMRRLMELSRSHSESEQARLRHAHSNIPYLRRRYADRGFRRSAALPDLSSATSNIPEITITSPQEVANRVSSGPLNSAIPGPSGEGTSGSLFNTNRPELNRLYQNPPFDRYNSAEIAARRNRMRSLRIRARHERSMDRRHQMRRNLHPRYMAQPSMVEPVVLNNNNSVDGLESIINRAMASAFAVHGDTAVASNVINITHRIQFWDFTKFSIPDISDDSLNVVVEKTNIHNDASCDISEDGRYLAVFFPSTNGFPDNTTLGLFSLMPNTRGQCLYTKSFGPNAITVSISPLSNYVLVGLAAKRLTWVFAQEQMVAQVFKLCKQEAGEDSMEHVCDFTHPCELNVRTHVSVNCARWLPTVGQGVVYGTNRGDLHICRPGDDESHSRHRSHDESNSGGSWRTGNMSYRRGSGTNSANNGTNTTSTQTVQQRVRRTASTQTEQRNA